MSIVTKKDLYFGFGQWPGRPVQYPTSSTGSGSSAWWGSGGIFQTIGNVAAQIIGSARSGSTQADIAGAQVYAMRTAQQEQMMNTFLYAGVAIAGILAVTMVLKK